jgi:hypothetical protein
VKDLEWISHFANNDLESDEYKSKMSLYLEFIGGLIRGALKNLGLDSKVKSFFDESSYSFKITLKT